MRYLFLVSVLALSGCASLRPPSVPDPRPSTPPQLDRVERGLSTLVMLALAVVGAGIALVVVLPGDDRIPWAITIGAAAVAGASLAINAALPYLPLVMGGATLAGVVWVAYRIARRRKSSTVQQ